MVDRSPIRARRHGRPPASHRSSPCTLFAMFIWRFVLSRPEIAGPDRLPAET
jgi:hypothetical protein